MLLHFPVILPAQPVLRFDPIIALAATCAASPATRHDLTEARDLAQRLMNHKVASLDAYARALVVQPPALLVFRESGRLTGVFGRLFLRDAAVEQLLGDRFDALDIDTDLLAREGDRPAALYAWGVAAETKAAGAAVLGAAVAIKNTLFPTMTAFTRAVTGAGRHIAQTRYGFRGLRHPDDDLMVNEPKLAEQAA